MKKLLFLLFIGLITSCTTVNRSVSLHKAEEFTPTRKYIGNFVDYFHTGPEIFGGFHLIWIKTSLYSSFGKISVYGNKCDFSEGDRLYLKRMYSTPGPYGNWEYQVENDSSVVYRVSKYRYENNALVRASF